MSILMKRFLYVKGSLIYFSNKSKAQAKKNASFELKRAGMAYHLRNHNVSWFSKVQQEIKYIYHYATQFNRFNQI